MMSSFTDCPLYLAGYGYLEAAKPPSPYDSHAHVTLSLSHRWRNQHVVLLHAHCEESLWIAYLAPSYKFFLKSRSVAVQFVAQYQGVSGLHYGQHPDDPETMLQVEVKLLAIPSLSINAKRPVQPLFEEDSLDYTLAELKPFLSPSV